MSDCDRPEDRPVSDPCDLRALDCPASVPVPGDVSGLDGQLHLPPFDFRPVSRDELEQVSPEPNAPSRPDWVACASKPRRLRFDRGGGRGVSYRGHALDPLVINGADDRRAYDDTRYPWGCVCQVLSSASVGSGVIVGPRHVLTASHVIDWDRVAREGVAVEVHRAGARVSAVTSAERVRSFTRVRGSVAGDELDEDYAVITTRDRIGDRWGWLGTRTYDSGWDDEPYWTNIGYPGDIRRGQFPIFQRRRFLDEFEFDYGSGRAMDTDADAAKGQSGGPMFSAFSNGQHYVVAVVSAQNLEDNENYCAGGSDLTRLVRIAREQDP